MEIRLPIINVRIEIVNRMSQTLSLRCLMVLMAILMLTISGCKGGKEAVEADPITCVVALDGTGSYKYMDKAKQTTMNIAQKLPGNSKMYVRWITDDSLSDKSGAVTAELPNTSKPMNPFDTKGKVRHKKALVKSAKIRKQLLMSIDRLKSPRAPMTDICGALYAAGVRFNSKAESKPVLILLTDMDDNVGLCGKYKTNLNGAIVKIMDFQAGQNDEKVREHWQSFLKEHGAESVEFMPVDEPFTLKGI